MLRFLKDWTLPVAMLAGMIGYPLFIRLSFLTPVLIFSMLFLTFCKISLADLKPRPLHLWLLFIQLAGCIGAYLLLFKFNKILAEAVMLCIICPTATSAAVITGKLGGSAASVSTYTLLINVLVAFVVPVFFPLVEAHPEITFFQSSAKILSRVFLLLICPFIVACLLRQFAPKVHRAMLSVPNLAFYLWGVALAIVTSQIFSSLLENTTELSLVVLIAVFTCAICSFQFFLGKTIGSKYDDRVSGGQSLGQKNTILAIWMAHTYLNPIAALGPGFYVAWQNIINSWQLWKKRRKDSAK